MTTRIAQISDTHLSADRPRFNENFDKVSDHLQTLAPDLIINTGDLALDGADSEGDLMLAAERHRAIGIDVHLLAGNHDVGDDPAIAKRQPVNEERLKRWASVVGPSHFVFDIPGWRLIGLDALILGTDHNTAHAQAEAIRGAVLTANGRSLALFLHKPICDETLDENDVSSRFLTPSRRSVLLDLLGGAAPTLACCGHVHQYRDEVIAGTRHIWAPGTAFLISDPWQPVFGAKTVGYIEHRFHRDGTHDHRLVTVRGLAHCDLLDAPEAYGDIRAWGAGQA
jgi:3',5'-cyclic AMP phosphodiesterase CpdA